MNRNKLLIIIGIILLVIVGLVLLWWFRFRTETPEPTGTPTATSTPEQVTTVAPATPERIAEEARYPLGLKQLAFSFAERFGSYSTDNPNKNIEDLQPQMTQRLQQAFATADRAGASGSFEGISTTALSSRIVTSGADRAELIVSTQRQRTRGTSEDVFYQDIKLSFINTNGTWFVDEARWQ